MYSNVYDPQALKEQRFSNMPVTLRLLSWKVKGFCNWKIFHRPLSYATPLDVKGLMSMSSKNLLSGFNCVSATEGGLF